MGNSTSLGGGGGGGAHPLFPLNAAAAFAILPQ